MNNLPEQPMIPSSMPPPELGWRRKRRVIIILVAVLIILGVGLVVFFLTRGKSARIQGRPTAAEEIPHPTVDPIPKDSDRDGLTNDEEESAGTSGTEFDTDRDGLSDIDEIKVWKTDPKKVDSDGDGFGDGIEAVRGFNPAGPGKLSP